MKNLIDELQEIKRALAHPEHFSALQLRAWRRRKSQLVRQITRTQKILRQTNLKQSSLFQ